MEKIMWYLEHEAFAGYTWLEVGVAAIGAFVLLKLIGWVRKPRYTDPNQIKATCSCGWKGSVGKYNPTCPRCNKRVA